MKGEVLVPRRVFNGRLIRNSDFPEQLQCRMSVRHHAVAGLLAPDFVAQSKSMRPSRSFTGWPSSFSRFCNAMR
jgi:hypothetical protein